MRMRRRRRRGCIEWGVKHHWALSREGKSQLLAQEPFPDNGLVKSHLRDHVILPIIGGIAFLVQSVCELWTEENI